MAVTSTNKKVVVVRFDREPLAGVGKSGLPFNDSGALEILTSNGTLGEDFSTAK